MLVASLIYYFSMIALSQITMRVKIGTMKCSSTIGDMCKIFAINSWCFIPLLTVFPHLVMVLFFAKLQTRRKSDKADAVSDSIESTVYDDRSILSPNLKRSMHSKFSIGEEPDNLDQLIQ